MSIQIKKLKVKAIGDWNKPFSNGPHKLPIETEGKQATVAYWGNTLPEIKVGKLYEIGYTKYSTEWSEYTLAKVNKDQHGPDHFIEIKEVKEEEEIEEQLTSRNEPESILQPIDDQSIKKEKECEIMQFAEGIETDTKEMAIRAFKLYEYVMSHIVRKDDFQTVMTSKGPQTFMKKTGFRKLALAFSISSEIMDEKFVETESGWFWKMRVRATAPNGRYSDGIAICQNYEKNMKKSLHDAYATAYTRALNRAISDLVGCGLVSLEEVEG